jgi:WD40 repeat protein
VAFRASKGRGLVHIHRFDLGAASEEHKELNGHSGSVNHLAFARTDKLVVVSGGDDGAVCVWDAQSGAQLHSFSGGPPAPPRCRSSCHPMWYGAASTTPASATPPSRHQPITRRASPHPTPA